LALWKIFNAISIPKSRDENFSADFCTPNIWGCLNRYVANPFILVLSPGHSDTNWFRPDHQSGQEIIWIGSKNSKFAQTTDIVDYFDPRSGISNPLHGELPHVQIFVNDGPNPIT